MCIGWLFHFHLPFIFHHFRLRTHQHYHRITIEVGFGIVVVVVVAGVVSPAATHTALLSDCEENTGYCVSAAYQPNEHIAHIATLPSSSVSTSLSRRPIPTHPLIIIFLFHFYIIFFIFISNIILLYIVDF